MMGFPIVLLPMFVFSMAAFMINGLIMMSMFWLNGEITARDILNTMKGLLFNVLAAMPLGLLIAEMLSWNRARGLRDHAVPALLPATPGSCIWIPSGSKTG
jgi:sulfur transfer protein SufE